MVAENLHVDDCFMRFDLLLIHVLAIATSSIPPSTRTNTFPSCILLNPIGNIIHILPIVLTPSNFLHSCSAPVGFQRLTDAIALVVRDQRFRQIGPADDEPRTPTQLPGARWGRWDPLGRVGGSNIENQQKAPQNPCMICCKQKRIAEETQLELCQIRHTINC